MLTVFDVMAPDRSQVGRYWLLADALKHAARVSGTVELYFTVQSFDPDLWDSSLPF